MEVANIALAETNSDNDYIIICRSKRGAVKCLVLSKELLKFLGESINKRLKIK